MKENSGNIRLKDLVVHFPVRQGTVKAVDHVSVEFERGKITGIIGESGCGKSVLGLAILGLLPPYAKTEGEIWYHGRNLKTLSPREMRKLRGRVLGLIPQNPGDSLNPARKIRGQILEAAALTGKPKTETIRSMRGLLGRFGFSEKLIPEVERAYPFELSGGMQQRAAAAMGAASESEWILADEPSKGLDWQLRQQMYETLDKLRKDCTGSMLIITHDLVLARQLCDTVAVMYGGQILEMGEQVLEKPLHPYTQGLLRSLPENGFQPMEGTAPAPGDTFTGCRFAPRCPYARKRCQEENPGFYEPENQRKVQERINYAGPENFIHQENDTVPGILCSQENDIVPGILCSQENDTVPGNSPVRKLTGKVRCFLYAGNEEGI